MRPRPFRFFAAGGGREHHATHMAGRVQAPLGGVVERPFSLFSDQGAAVSAGSLASSSLSHQLRLDETAVGRLFFSRVNVDALQHGLRYRVHTASGGALTIGRQSDVELGIVMRSVYMQNGRNGAGDPLEEVRELNGIVLDWAVPRVTAAAEQYLRYRTDVARLPEPMPRGEFASNKGTRVLEWGA